MGLKPWLRAAGDLYLLRHDAPQRLAARASKNVFATLGMLAAAFLMLLALHLFLGAAHNVWAQAGQQTLAAAVIFGAWSGILHGLARLFGGRATGMQVFKALPPLHLLFALAFAPLLWPWLRAAFFAWTMLGLAEITLGLHKISALRTGLAIVIPLALLYGLNLAVAEGIGFLT